MLQRRPTVWGEEAEGEEGWADGWSKGGEEGWRPKGGRRAAGDGGPPLLCEATFGLGKASWISVQEKEVRCPLLAPLLFYSGAEEKRGGKAMVDGEEEGRAAGQEKTTHTHSLFFSPPLPKEYILPFSSLFFHRRDSGGTLPPGPTFIPVFYGRGGGGRAAATVKKGCLCSCVAEGRGGGIDGCVPEKGREGEGALCVSVVLSSEGGN